MKTTLRLAEQEIKRLKRASSSSNPTTLDFVLIYSRSEDDMKRLTGYPAFAQALAELGGEHTEENIQEACRMSHFSRESVLFDDVQRSQHENRHIPMKCTKALAKKVLYSNGYLYHMPSSLR